MATLKKRFLRTRLGKRVRRAVIKRRVKKFAGRNVANTVDFFLSRKGKRLVRNTVDFLQSPTGLALSGLALSEIRRVIQSRPQKPQRTQGRISRKSTVRRR